MLLLQVIGVMAIIGVGCFIPRTIGTVLLSILLINVIHWSSWILVLFTPLGIIALIIDIICELSNKEKES